MTDLRLDPDQLRTPLDDMRDDTPRARDAVPTVAAYGAVVAAQQKRSSSGLGNRLGFVARRPGLVMAILWMIAIILSAFVPRLFTTLNPLRAAPAQKRQGPSWEHLFGTDELGRDLFTRMVHGSAVSLQAAVLAVLVGVTLGALLGLLAGFVGGVLDAALMRVVDVLLAIPSLLLSLALVTALGFGVVNVAIAVGIASVAGCARIMRSEVLRVRQSVFVEAAHASGSRWLTVLFRHVLPNSVGPVLVLGALEFGTAILSISSLSFLGYGVQPPEPEWGALVAAGRDFIATDWWLTTMPGLTIAATVLAANRIARALDGERRLALR